MTSNELRYRSAVAGAALMLTGCGMPVDNGATSTTGGSSTTTTSSTTTSSGEECALASSGLSELPISGLPTAVAATRTAVIKAALACDYERLAEIAGQSEHGFTYSFGEDGDPASYWEDARGGGERILENLVRILNMSHTQKQTQFIADVYTTIYVWPAAAGEDPSQQDWEEVSTMYGEDEIAQMQDAGVGYIGWRAGFTEDGRWVSFVAGD